MEKSLFVLFFLMLTVLPAFAQTGDIQGTVYQRSTEKPLAGADVRITETEQTQKTDENGVFQFTELPEGTYTFVVTHPLETTPTKISVAVSSGDTTEIKIYLGEAVRLETIVIEGKRLPPTISRTEIRGSELLRIPGAANDALKGLTTLPSIGIPNDYFGVLYIRGSEPGSNLYYLDRTPLGYPFHWGGLLSTISSETIETIDIYAGGYGAEFGLDSQAVLDIHARDSIDGRFDGKFNLNIFYSEGLLEGRIGEKGYVSVSGRRSYFDLIVGPIIKQQTGQEQQLPYFSDYQFKFAYSFGEKHHLTVNAFAATDHFKIEEQATLVEEEAEIPETEDLSGIPPDLVEENPEIEDIPEIPPEEAARSSAYFKNGFDGQGIHLRSNFTDRLTSHLSLTRSHNFLNIDFKAVVEERYSLEPTSGEWDYAANFVRYDIKVSAPVWTLREDISYRLTPSLQLESGFLSAFSPATSSEKGWLEENFPSDHDLNYTTETPDGQVLSESTFEDVDDEFGHDFYRTEGYVQGRYDPLSFLSVALGVRIDYLNVIEAISIQPRGSISFNLPNGSNLRFAYGHYEQNPLPYQLLSDDGNPALEPSLTRHYIMELEYPFSSRTELKFATYYKDARELVTTKSSLASLYEGSGEEVASLSLAPEVRSLSLAPFDEIPNYLNEGMGYVGGAEVFLRHRIPDKFFGWVSYAYTHAERREHILYDYQPYLFDNTHIVSVVANYSFTPDFEVGAKWQYLSGTSEVPISSLVLIQDPVTGGLNPLLASADEQLSTELSPYHKLDVRISRKWNVSGMKIGGFLDILNVYNRKNEIKFIFEEAILDVQGEEVSIDREEFEAQQIPRIVYFGLTLEF